MHAKLLQSCLTPCDPMDCMDPMDCSQEYWGGLPWPPPGYLPNPGMEPISLMSPTLPDGSFFFFLLVGG